MRKDLFEVLRDKVHCEYISDLLFIDYELVRVHLEHLDYNEFELRELIDAANWFGHEKLDAQSKEEAYNYLLNLHKPR